jgi:crotonobetaine/carnitine-CoA ligase
LDNPSYGLTEAVGLTIKDPREVAPAGSSGKIDSEFWDVKIFDDEDKEAATGTSGEIVCRPKAPNVMMNGYWGRPDATLEVFRHLWFHTGDVGRLDKDGYLYFVDRKKDYLRRRGENISSYEIEETLAEHPDVVVSAAHAVPSELGEDDLKITVVIRPDSSLTEEDLAKWCVNRLPYFAMPRYIEFRDDLPRSELGRVQKYRLRDEGVTEQTWDLSKSSVEVPRR